MKRTNDMRSVTGTARRRVGVSALGVLALLALGCTAVAAKQDDDIADDLPEQTDRIETNGRRLPAVTAAGPGIQIRMLGQPEVVLPSETMACATARAIDVPDAPPSAFRRGDGQVVMIASNRQNYIAAGPSLNSVKRIGCERLLALAGNDDPSQFRDQEWVTGVMPVRPGLMVGVIHNEHHGEYRDKVNCPLGEAERLCWYASSTLMTSTDGGRTFSRPPAPGNVLAAPPGRYAPGLKRISLSVPKILRRGDYLYVMAAKADRNRRVLIQQCLFRARVDAPLDWRAWDGKGFGLKRTSAYAGASAQDCVGVLRGNVPAVKFIPSRNLYVALLMDRDSVDYATSPDLVTWSGYKSLRGLSHYGNFDAAKGQPDWYFSLLDPTSRSAGFDTLEKEPYLYFVRIRTAGGKIQRRARDLMRQRVAIS